jgi:hypothetical protein
MQHGTNDIGNATNGSSEGAAKAKKAKLASSTQKKERRNWRRQVQTTRPCRGKRSTAVEIALQAAAAMTAAMAV